MEASINGCTAVVDLLIRFGAKPEGTSYDVGQETLPACSSFVVVVHLSDHNRVMVAQYTPFTPEIFCVSLVENENQNEKQNKSK